MSNKKGALTDIFLFMIISFVILLIMGIFLYMSHTVNTEVREKIKEIHFEVANGTQIVDNTLGAVDQSYQSFYWISVLLIVGMMIAILIGSYMVTTRPIFFIPYFFITIIAIIISVVISNTYGELIETPDLASYFEKFIGANFIMGYLPVWVTALGIGGAVIMFSRMGSKDNQLYYTAGGYYG